ncbi:MAG: FTR1 family protein, partial [Thermodesulfobacteriota bacterium]
AVYREGAETALFYLALFSTSDVSRGAVIAGFIAGSFVLVMIFLLFKYGEMRLPIGPFFAVTSTLLYYLAFVFSGKGVHALQEAGWISETHWDIVPKVKFIGLYPTVETIALQVALIGAMLIAVVYSLLIKPYREKLALGRDISHIGIDIDMLHDLLDDVNGHTTEIAKWARDSNVEEVQSHIRELDRKVHEVMGHLEALKRDTEDSFIETEKEISPQ